jgi:heme-degrading monooxygenase HmoA
MWNIKGDSPEERFRNVQKLRNSFESLRGRVPGLIALEIGVDQSHVEYACDVVLYSEFESNEALAGYANHPEHLRVKDELLGLRIARFQVDYTVD